MQKISDRIKEIVEFLYEVGVVELIIYRSPTGELSEARVIIEHDDIITEHLQSEGLTPHKSTWATMDLPSDTVFDLPDNHRISIHVMGELKYAAHK